MDNRVALIERNIDRFLRMESGGKERGLERLRVAIHNEEAERRLPPELGRGIVSSGRGSSVIG
jgi:hypothetical protein